jgi:hypothetical protein
VREPASQQACATLHASAAWHIEVARSRSLSARTLAGLYRSPWLDHFLAGGRRFGRQASIDPRSWPMHLARAAERPRPCPPARRNEDPSATRLPHDPAEPPVLLRDVVPLIVQGQQTGHLDFRQVVVCVSRRRVSGPDRDLVPAALEFAVLEGWIVIDDPHVSPGPSRPS